MKIKVLLHYLIPATLTNISFFLFTIIDGMFVGNGVGTNALGAVNIVYPFLWLNYGINVLVTIGGVTITAIRFGRDDIKGANEAFIHSLTLTLIVSTFMTLSGTLLTRPIALLLGASNTYIDLVREYLFWYSLFIIPSALSTNLQHFCRNDGDPQLVAVCTILSTGLNIILDYLFIFPFRLGIMGAALATGISHIFSLLIILTHYIFLKGRLRIKAIQYKPYLFKKIIVRGIPDMISQFSPPVTIFFMNYVLALNLGDLGINTYAIISNVASMALAVLYGVSEGLQPLIGRSYGAKNIKDLKFYFNTGLIIAFVGSALTVLLIDLFSQQICELFGPNVETIKSTVQNMPKYSWGFIFAGMNALISAYLYSTKRTEASILFNILRCLVLNSLCIVLLPLIFGIGVIWYSYGISEIFVLFLGYFLIKVTERNGISYN